MGIKAALAILEEPLFPKGKKTIEKVINPNSSDQDALLFGLNIENKSYDLYRDVEIRPLVWSSSLDILSKRRCEVAGKICPECGCCEAVEKQKPEVNHLHLPAQSLVFQQAVHYVQVISQDEPVHPAGLIFVGTEDTVGNIKLRVGEERGLKLALPNRLKDCFRG